MIVYNILLSVGEIDVVLIVIGIIFCKIHSSFTEINSQIEELKRDQP